MSIALRSPRRWSAAEYLSFEETTRDRHEFFDGVVYSMVGGSIRHNLIAGNLFDALKQALRDRCEVHQQATQLRVTHDAAEDYYYPDVFVTCCETDQSLRYRERPSLIAEVLSPTTERLDRGEKFLAYKLIGELQEYVIIAQDVPQVEIFRRRNAWQVETCFMADTLRLESVDLELPIRQLYHRISF